MYVSGLKSQTMTSSNEFSFEFRQMPFWVYAFVISTQNKKPKPVITLNDKRNLHVLNDTRNLL